ncbi:MAG: hypothetical protein IT363_11195 [Methanoregulaceae archaeon]|nr:hypothetical protein [Methanoregulaceae archaeon]
MPGKPGNESKTTSSTPILGGIIGAILGWGFLFLCVQVVSSLMGSRNLLVMVLNLALAIANFIGIVAYPVIGYKLGSKYMFTSTRTTIDRDCNSGIPFLPSNVDGSIGQSELSYWDKL